MDIASAVKGAAVSTTGTIAARKDIIAALITARFGRVSMFTLNLSVLRSLNVVRNIHFNIIFAFQSITILLVCSKVAFMTFLIVSLAAPAKVFAAYMFLFPIDVHGSGTC